jgi:lipoate-protein ligase A
MDLERLFLALDTRRRTSAAAGGRLLGRSIGWMNRWLESPVTVSDVEDRLVAACAEVWGIRYIESGLTAAEEARAVLLKEKYADPSWNLKGIG